MEEVELCAKPSFTTENLPLLLNQFYVERLQEMTQLKHMLMLRWTRFAMERPKIVDELSEDYRRRIELVHLVA